MKKIIALLSVFALCLTAFAIMSVSADNFEPVLRFAVYSDIHVGIADDERCAKVASAMQYAYSYAESCEYDDLDAFIFAGDIGHAGEDHQWIAARDTIVANTDTDDTALMVLMGNHEYYLDEETAHDRFLDVFKYTNGGGEATVLPSSMDAVNTHMVINGIHVIGLSLDSKYPYETCYTEEKIAWVEDQLEIAAADTGSDKPIFVFQHVGCENTVIGTESGAFVGLNEIYSKYPQVICMAGHSHAPINCETSIWQDTFTALGTGAFQYATVPIYDGVKVYLYDKDVYDIDQFYIVEVDAKGATRITMHDVDENKIVGETYLIDSYNTADFKYTADRINNMPFDFPENATVTVQNATAHKVNFTFTPVMQDQLSATAYHVEIVDPDGKVVNNQYIGWAFYDESEEDQVVEFGNIIPGIKEGVEYTLYIEGVNTGFKQLIDDTAFRTRKLSTKFHFGELIETEAEPTEEVVAPVVAVGSGLIVWLYVGIAAAVLTIGAVVVFIVLKKKKGNNK